MCNIIEELRNDMEEISDNDYCTTLVSSFFKSALHAQKTTHSAAAICSKCTTT